MKYIFTFSPSFSGLHTVLDGFIQKRLKISYANYFYEFLLSPYLKNALSKNNLKTGSKKPEKKAFSEVVIQCVKNSCFYYGSEGENRIPITLRAADFESKI